MNRPSIFNRCPLEPRELVPIVKSQKLVQVLAVYGGPCASWPWHETSRKSGPVQEPAGVCKTTETNLYLCFIAKCYGFRFKGMSILENSQRKIKTLNL